MELVNPKFIPRNHLVEEALQKASNLNDFGLFHELLNVLQNPYVQQQGDERFQEVPKNVDDGYQTYCGT